MAILIGQTLLRDSTAISELTRQSIAFIDGGTEWLQWAVRGPEVRARFADESVMTGAVQSGLHGTAFTYLRNLRLMVSPVKLMTFSLEDLRLVAAVEVDPTNPRRLQRVQAVLAAHGLLTASWRGALHGSTLSVSPTPPCSK